MPHTTSHMFDFDPSSPPPQPPAGGPSGGEASAPRRYALGLPAGSVRALLAIMVLGLIWSLMYLQKELPLYLQYLMFLILGHYFATRHRDVPSVEVRESTPLYLPRGVIRALIVLGFVAVLAAVYYRHRDNLGQLFDDLKMNTDQARNRFLPLLMVIGFFLGLLMSKIGNMMGGKEGMPGWYQDVQAWFALIAMLGLGGFVIIQLVINPNLEEAKQIQLPHIDNVLASIVGFYFGARS